MTTRKNPSWWKTDYDSAWDRVKNAFERDWEQTKHDLGSKTAPDLHQNAADTVKQAVGSEKTTSASGTFADEEPAYRFGYGARRHYGSRYPLWSDDLERQLESDWGEEWDRARPSVRRGWSYQPADEARKAS